ncbi:hypothetical protein SC171_22000 [Pantoea cypripedii]|uniref:hypothetical protein n=1 Tax=Pantoea cypripedii TaxID=55209 RepID=UPI002FC96453
MVWLFLAVPMVVNAAPPSPQPCRASFMNFVVDREPHGYPINQAELSVTSAGKCSVKGHPGKDVAIRIGDTRIDVYDRVTQKHTIALSTTFININHEKKTAEITNNYLNLNLEVPVEVQQNTIVIKINEKPALLFGPAGPPFYNLRIGSGINIDLGGQRGIKNP